MFPNRAIVELGQSAGAHRSRVWKFGFWSLPRWIGMMWPICIHDLAQPSRIILSSFVARGQTVCAWKWLYDSVCH